MTDRLREIEQRCEKAPMSGPLFMRVDRVEDIPYLRSVIKEQAEEIERLRASLLSLCFPSMVDVRQLLSGSPILQQLMESNEEHSEDAKPLDG